MTFDPMPQQRVQVKLPVATGAKVSALTGGSGTPNAAVSGAQGAQGASVRAPVQSNAEAEVAAGIPPPAASQPEKATEKASSSLVAIPDGPAVQLVDALQRKVAPVPDGPALAALQHKVDNVAKSQPEEVGEKSSASSADPYASESGLSSARSGGVRKSSNPPAYPPGQSQQQQQQRAAPKEAVEAHKVANEKWSQFENKWSSRKVPEQKRERSSDQPTGNSVASSSSTRPPRLPNAAQAEVQSTTDINSKSSAPVARARTHSEPPAPQASTASAAPSQAQYERRLPELVSEVHNFLRDAVRPTDTAGWCSLNAHAELLLEELHWLLSEIPGHSVARNHQSSMRSRGRKSDDLQVARKQVRYYEKEHNHLKRLAKLADPMVQNQMREELWGLDEHIQQKRLQIRKMQAENRRRDRSLGKVASEATADQKAKQQMERLEAEFSVLLVKNTSLQGQVDHAQDQLNKVAEARDVLGERMEQAKEVMASNDQKLRQEEQHYRESKWREMEQRLEQQIGDLTEKRKMVQKNYEREKRSIDALTQELASESTSLEHRLTQLEREEAALRRQIKQKEEKAKEPAPSPRAYESGPAVICAPKNSPNRPPEIAIANAPEPQRAPAPTPRNAPTPRLRKKNEAAKQIQRRFRGNSSRKLTESLRREKEEALKQKVKRPPVPKFSSPKQSPREPKQSPREEGAQQQKVSKPPTKRSSSKDKESPRKERVKTNNPVKVSAAAPKQSPRSEPSTKPVPSESVSQAETPIQAVRRARDGAQQASPRAQEELQDAAASLIQQKYRKRPQRAKMAEGSREKPKVEQVGSDSVPQQPQGSASEESAAVQIQRRYRGNRKRQEVADSEQYQNYVKNKQAQNCVTEGARSTPEKKDQNESSVTENEAAVQIQKRYRGRQARQALEPCRKQDRTAEAKIQNSSQEQGGATHDHHVASEEKAEALAQEEAALKIQKRYRGNSARQLGAPAQRANLSGEDHGEQGHMDSADTTPLTDQEKAAVHIQSKFRGNKVRQDLSARKAACNDEELDELAHLANPMSPKRPEVILLQEQAQEEQQNAEDLASLNVAESLDATTARAQQALSKLNENPETEVGLPNAAATDATRGSDDDTLGAAGDVTVKPPSAQPPSSARGRRR